MKKAIIVVSFGTSYPQALRKSIEKIEDKIRDKFREYKVYRAFTSHKIIRKIENLYGDKILTPEEVLEELYEKGFEEVLVQPLHIIPGEEYEYIKFICRKYENKFRVFKLGRPIFYYQGIEGVSNDYSLFIESIKHILDNNESVVLFGHGTSHPAGATYGCIQTVLQDEGYENVFVGTVEGYPTIDNVIKRIKRKNIKEVLLMPLMVVAGDHAINDMASDEEGSWKSQLQSQGIKVNLLLKGLGEVDSFVKLYIDRVKDLIEEKYMGIGESKKVINNENSNNFIKL